MLMLFMLGVVSIQTIPSLIKLKNRFSIASSPHTGNDRPVSSDPTVVTGVYISAISVERDSKKL